MTAWTCSTSDAASAGVACLYLASRQGFEVDSHFDEAVGVLTRNEKGILWVSVVTLHLKIACSDEKPPSPADEQQLHRSAHEQCCIANSITTDVRVEGT